MSNKLSFIWRSVWEAKSVTVAGARWKVGLGNHIKIVGKPWLLDEANPYITSSSPAFGDHTVSSLLCADNRNWDENTISDLFNARDQSCIRSICLPETDREDDLYWGK